MNKKKEMVKRLRKHFNLSKKDVSDENLLKIGGDTYAGACINLRMAAEELIKTIRKEYLK